MANKEIVERIIEHLEDLAKLHKETDGYRSYHFIPAYLAGFYHGVILSTPFEDTAAIWRQILAISYEVDEMFEWDKFAGDPVHLMIAQKMDEDAIIQKRILREITIMQKLLKSIEDENKPDKVENT